VGYAKSCVSVSRAGPRVIGSPVSAILDLRPGTWVGGRAHRPGSSVVMVRFMATSTGTVSGEKIFSAVDFSSQRTTLRNHISVGCTPNSRT